MSFRSFCSSLCNFFTWPFRKIAGCFKTRGEPRIIHRSPEARLSPKIYMRPKTQKEKQKELEGKIHFRPLFLPDHFSPLSDSKNDIEFKSKAEKERQKKERIKAREALMFMLEHMDEIERRERLEEIYKK